MDSINSDNITFNPGFRNVFKSNVKIILDNINIVNMLIFYIIMVIIINHLVSFSIILNQIGMFMIVLINKYYLTVIKINLMLN